MWQRSKRDLIKTLQWFIMMTFEKIRDISRFITQMFQAPAVILDNIESFSWSTESEKMWNLTWSCTKCFIWSFICKWNTVKYCGTKITHRNTRTCTHIHTHAPPFWLLFLHRKTKNPINQIFVKKNPTYCIELPKPYYIHNTKVVVVKKFKQTLYI